MDGDAALEESDGDHEEALLGIASDEDPFESGERPVGDPHALPFAEIGIREDRQLGADEPLNRVDLRVRNDLKLVPALAEHSHEAPPFAHFEKTPLLHGRAEKRITAEKRHALPAP